MPLIKIGLYDFLLLCDNEAVNSQASSRSVLFQLYGNSKVLRSIGDPVSHSQA